MSLRRAIKLFEAHEPFRQFKNSTVILEPSRLATASIRGDALHLAETIEPRNDRSDLHEALSHLDVEYDPENYRQVSAMLFFLARQLFRDASRPAAPQVRRRIAEYEGSRFFFVTHTSYYDYPLVSYYLHRLGLTPPVMHVAGTMTRGWVSGWVAGLRSLRVPKTLNPLQHRAYSWFCAALARANETQVVFARTSRYTVRARDGILREPYVPHCVLAAVKATGRALVVPVAISYAAIPEDRYLASASFSPLLSMLPRHWSFFLPALIGLKNPDSLIRGMERAFGDVSIDLGEPFELRDDDSLTQQRISHRAIEEIARNKLIHPSHLVAKAMQGLERADIKTLRQSVEQEIEKTREFFRTRYHREPPFHTIITSDLPEALSQGVKTLTRRGAISRSFFRRKYSARNFAVLRFYGYQADRRIYPLSGHNTLTVINAGMWGYTLALHIGANLLKRPDLAEHSLVLYDSREELIEKLTVEGKHPWHFKDMPLPRSVRPEADLLAAIGDTSLVLVVTPSKYFHSIILKIVELMPDGADVVIATKGFIPETGLLPYQTVQHEMERLGKRLRLSVLSGANLAHEIVTGGAGVTQIACEEFATFERLRDLIETPLFRVVYSDDIIGASISAALKNVYAIGFGLLEGSKIVPENFLATYATLATREIRHFGMLLGASPQTFDAESQVWMADLLATCRGGRSANFGRDLAGMDDKHGKYLPARLLLEQYRKKKLAIEGFEASRFAHRMATQRGYHPPILGEIYSILHAGTKVEVDRFIEKCLDALSQDGDYGATPSIRLRPRRR
ncbi:MAG: hypothetical protein ACOYXY_05475 [Thermodesulfobacteriota bacterium]